MQAGREGWVKRGPPPPIWQQPLWQPPAIPWQQARPQREVQQDGGVTPPREGLKLDNRSKKDDAWDAARRADFEKSNVKALNQYQCDESPPTLTVAVSGAIGSQAGRSRPLRVAGPESEGR